MYLPLSLRMLVLDLHQPGNLVSDQSVEDVKNINSTVDCENMADGSKWVNMFVHEMMNAADVDDARMRAAKILEAFEQSIASHSRTSKEVVQQLLSFCRGIDTFFCYLSPLDFSLLSYLPYFFSSWNSWNMFL